MNLRDSLGFCRSRGGTLVDESNPALQGFVSWELWRRHRQVKIYFIATLNDDVYSMTKESHCYLWYMLFSGVIHKVNIGWVL